MALVSDTSPAQRFLQAALDWRKGAVCVRPIVVADDFLEIEVESIRATVSVINLLFARHAEVLARDDLLALPVSLDDAVYHTQCVARGCENALLIADMPFGSFQGDPQSAFDSAARLMGEGQAHMVKIEGGAVMAETVAFLVDRGVPVCGHLGLTPQSVNQLGGFRVQGRQESVADRLRQDAQSLQNAGASVLVLEAVPSGLAKEITQSLTIPTIGIGAGPDTDGQVLVLYDLLGIYPQKSPKFSKNFLDGAGSVSGAAQAFIEDVRSGQFPVPEHSF